MHGTALLRLLLFFFFNDTATTEIYTLSLHDALPISPSVRDNTSPRLRPAESRIGRRSLLAAHRRTFSSDSPRARRTARSDRRAGSYNRADRKSTRLNSSHSQISYAVFCLKKKKKKTR